MTEDESKQLHPSNFDPETAPGIGDISDIIEDPTAPPKTLSQELKDAAELFEAKSKEFMQAFLYLEQTCREAAVLAHEAAAVLKEIEDESAPVPTDIPENGLN